jgi:mevalonate kinase
LNIPSSIQFPSKTFLLGEYIVLDQGPCLILTTPPYFEMKFTPQRNMFYSNKQIFHPQSPAGIWVQQHADFFRAYQLEFFDPHAGKGGFGASGAEFLSVYNAIYPLKKNTDFIERLVHDYQAICASQATKIPSGADLVAQIYGRITYWHRIKNVISTSNWPFEDLSYLLIRTGQTCVTHEAIKKLPKTTVDSMTQITQEGYSAFQTKNRLGFIEAIKGYADCMKQAGCLLDTTENLIQTLYQSHLIRAAKGCGAMGAEVVLILIDTEKVEAFSAWLERMKIVSV